MPGSRIVSLALVAALTVGCGLTDQPSVNTAELLAETQGVVSDLRLELTSFQDQVDSLRMELARQDSLLRALANLQGMQLPERAPASMIPDPTGGGLQPPPPSQ